MLCFLTFFLNNKWYFNNGDCMKVKIFDEAHEKDLEDDINEFLTEFSGEIIDIKFQVSTSMYSEEQIYCFSAMIIYK